MFEEEIKMEEKSSNVVPLLMAIVLVGLLVGGIGYFVVESRRSVSEPEAQKAASAMIAAQGPQRVHFHVGFVKPSPDEQPFDPHYRLLEKAGVVKLSKPTYKGVDVKLTPEGQELLKLCGAKEEKNADGTEAYTVTLAERKLIKVAGIEMVNPTTAKIDYEWNWQPTALGLKFDVNSAEMMALPIWDTAVLIQKYGSTYYKDSKVKTTTMVLLWDEKAKAWRPAS